MKKTSKLFAPHPPRIMHPMKRRGDELPKPKSTFAITTKFDENYVKLFRKQVEIEQSQEAIAAEESQKLFDDLNSLGLT